MCGFVKELGFGGATLDTKHLTAVSRTLRARRRLMSLRVLSHGGPAGRTTSSAVQYQFHNLFCVEGCSFRVCCLYDDQVDLNKREMALEISLFLSCTLAAKQ